jgi:PAS domain S-box-containing protein
LTKRALNTTSAAKYLRDERRLSGALELIPHLAWCAAPDGRLKFCNESWLKTTGLAREQAKGSDWVSVLHAEDVTGVQDIWRSALASGTAAEAEARMRAADGSYRWYLIRAMAQFARSGELLDWYGTATDIHDRKLVEEAQHETEAKWRSVFDSTAIGVAITDMTGRFLWVNPTYERILGYSQDELRELRFIEVTHEAFRTHNTDLIKECLDGKRRQFQIEKLYRRKDGVPVWVRNNVSIIRDQSGAPRFIMALAENIMLERLASIVEEQYDFLAVADLEGRPLYVNRSGQELVGLDGVDELRDTEAIRYFFPEDWPSITQMIKGSILTDGSWSGETRFRHLKTGKPVPVLYQGFRIDDPETGLASNIAIVCRDIAARKEAERAAQAAQTELARVNRLTTMGEMAASIAHEINQPLTAIVANGEASLRLLAFRPPDLAETSAALRSIIDDARRAAEITGGIRNMARRIDSERIPVNLNEVIAKVLSLTRGETGVWDVAVQTELKAGLPYVIADRVQLQQVVLNLIMNAIEAMTTSKGGPRQLEISTDAEREGRVLVSVKDSGIGIGPEADQRIFEPFFTTKVSGVGLGLSICRSIIESHGGRLWAAPAKPHGAVFQFSLPSQQMDAVAQ